MPYVDGQQCEEGDRIELDWTLGGFPAGFSGLFSGRDITMAAWRQSQRRDGDRATVVKVNSQSSLRVAFDDDPLAECPAVRHDIWRLLGRVNQIVPPKRAMPNYVETPSNKVCVCLIDQLMSGGCACGAVTKYTPPKWGGA